MTTYQAMRKSLENLTNSRQAVILSRFFKTGPGEYGEGDLFRGIRVPQLRQLVRQCKDVALDDAILLLESPFHEDRLFALLLMVDSYRSGNDLQKELIYRRYMENTAHINNWDLVDLSAEHIAGAHLLNRSRQPLYRLVRSPLLWNRRIGLLATFHFIKKQDFTDTLKLIRIMLHDREDLIHKAMGWMLREIGKRDGIAEEEFLKEYLTELPRTTLRYAIERFPEQKRLAYLKGNI